MKLYFRLHIWISS